MHNVYNYVNKIYNTTNENYWIYFLFDLWIRFKVCLFVIKRFSIFNENHITRRQIRRAREFPEQSRLIVRLVLHNSFIYKTVLSVVVQEWHYIPYLSHEKSKIKKTWSCARKTVRITDRIIFVFRHRASSSV